MHLHEGPDYGFWQDKEDKKAQLPARIEPGNSQSEVWWATTWATTTAHVILKSSNQAW